MLKLKDIILQLKEEDCRKVREKLVLTKADKFLTLFNLLRENKYDDENIAKELNVNQNAYYTLKSRLYDKIQEYLTSNLEGSRTNLLNTVSNIPNLIYDTPKETAIIILKKLEEDLALHDLPYELCNVYSALKKLHLHSRKYHEYSKQYNKHLAYTASLEKGEDIICNFHKTLGEYFLSRDNHLIDNLCIIKEEISSLAKLYESHNLAIYKNIIDVSFALFLPKHEAIKEDEPVEDMLDFMEKNLLEHNKNLTYKYLLNIHCFLKFEYYMQLKQYKKAKIFYEELLLILPSFMLYNFCCFTSRFLLSRLEYSIINKTAKNLEEENSIYLKTYKADIDDLPNYVNYIKYQVVCKLLSGKFHEALIQLKSLLNNISTRNFLHTEIELKLLMVYLQVKVNKNEVARDILKNVSRKIKELNRNHEYENALLFSKILQLLLSPSSISDLVEKLSKFRTQFNLYNEGKNRMLEYLPLDNEILASLDFGKIKVG